MDKKRKNFSLLLKQALKVAMNNNYSGPAQFVKLSPDSKDMFPQYLIEGNTIAGMDLIVDDKMKNIIKIGRYDDDYFVEFVCAEKSLLMQLEEAINTEDYEMATLLRNKIQSHGL